MQFGEIVKRSYTIYTHKGQVSGYGHEVNIYLQSFDFGGWSNVF